MKKTWILSAGVLLTLAACSNAEETNTNSNAEIENNMSSDETNEQNENQHSDENHMNNDNMNHSDNMNHDEMDHDNENMNEDMNHDNEDMDHGTNGGRDSFEESAAELPAENEGAPENLLTTNTKNVTRIDQEEPEDFSIQVSQTIWPATHETNQPGTVILANPDEWQQTLSALTLVHHPNDGPVLLMEDGLSDELLTEIERLAPLGNDEGLEVLAAAELTADEEEMLADYEWSEMTADSPAAFAQEADAAFADTLGEFPEKVLIASSEEEHQLLSMTAGSWISHMNEPVLFVDDDGIPAETEEALAERDQAAMYLLGSEEIISGETEQELSEFGNTSRIDAETPAELSIAFAQFEEDGFGWGITEPGHGFVFASTDRPEFALAGAPFAHLGKHAPVLWLEEGELDDEHRDYLATIKPSYTDNPMEGPYNHSYLLGTEEDISFHTQGLIDTLMEIEAEDGGGHADH
ncbi:cell wall-binding repeat-containing protein [Alkalicoccus luteus]|uniref:cell wall-binding repeat-containing protein n=1 Tax=Alkalicoccus luteus TaxID=1237094 RepID=UPI00403460BC